MSLRPLAAGLGLALTLLALTLLASPPALAQHDRPAPDEHAAAPGEGAADGHPDAHGGGHGEHGGLDPKRLAFQLINFGLLMAILGFFGGRAINKALAGRHDQMKKDLEEAGQARAAAQARLAQQEKRLANLEKEIVGLRASIKQEAIQEEQRLVAAAEEKATRIQEETRFLMDQQVKEAEIRFRQEVAAAAVRIAEELVRRSMKSDDESRLNAGFIADLESGKSTAAAATTPTPGTRS
jgi:F-type H+-transporting ATPase subunit b